IISAQTLQDGLETHQQELLDFLNYKLIITLTLLFILPTAMLCFIKIKYPRPKIIVLNLLICIALIIVNVMCGSAHYMSLIRNARQLRYYINPVRPIYAVSKFISQRLTYNKPMFTELDPSPQRLLLKGKAKLVVLVVGESD